MQIIDLGNLFLDEESEELDFVLPWPWPWPTPDGCTSYFNES